MLFGYKVSEWNQILFRHEPMKRASEGDLEQQQILDNVVKERLLYDMRSSGVRTDLLNVSGTSKFMTRPFTGVSYPADGTCRSIRAGCGVNTL